MNIDCDWPELVMLFVAGMGFREMLAPFPDSGFIRLVGLVIFIFGLVPLFT